MLRLERLEIAGFKSFPDRTSVVFGDGITAVVGPNGCGKSNIAEAISWVLGEQSPKNLRGGKMEDVIFNGTSDRKPVGMAEVLLTLVATEDITGADPQAPEADDESRFEAAIDGAEQAAEVARLLVEESTPREPDAQATASGGTLEGATFDTVEQAAEVAPEHRSRHGRYRRRRAIAISAGERITVGRRLYRTGDSEYLMNGRPCLLRDIQDLFAGTGLGGAHYAIIEQGRIGQILSSKPLDRRALIEEAAGITRFKFRKRAAELKLESAKQNLTRLNDIISEVERQVNSLKRQAAKSRRFRRLREEMRSLLKMVYSADYRRLTEAAERNSSELQAAGVELQRLDGVLAEHQDEYRAVSAQSREAEEALTALRERAAAVDLEADRVRNRRAFEEQQLGELSARIAQLERESHVLNERLSLFDAENDRRAADVKLLDAQVASQHASLVNREGDYQAKLSGLREAEDQIERLRQQLLTQLNVTERLRNLRATLEDELRRVETRQASLKAELERSTTRREEASLQYSNAVSELELGRTRLSELAARIAELSTRLTGLRAESGELQAQLVGVQGERTAAEQRLASLEDLDRHRAYYSDAVQQVLSPEHAAQINALGTLADFVNVEPQYERLIESLFSRELQCILVPTIDDALAGAEYLKSGGLGRGAFLVVGLHGAEEHNFDPDRDENDQNGPHMSHENDSWVDEEEPKFQLDVLRAIDLMGLRPEIRSVVERAFPDKSTASVVPHMEAALHLSMENGWRTYVTHDGEQVVNGRLIVTAAQADQQGTSLLALKRNIRELRARIETLRVEEAGLSSRFDTSRSALLEVEQEAQLIDSRLREQEKLVVAGVSQLEGLERDRDRAQQHVRVVEGEIDQTAREHSELESRLQQTASDLEHAQALKDQAQEALTTAQSVLGELRSRVEELGRELSSERADLAARAERLNAARSEVKRIESESEDLRSRANHIRLELYESHTRVEELTTARAEGEEATGRLEVERASLASEIAAATESLGSLRSRADDLDVLLAELRQQFSTAQERRGQLEVERARVESDASHLSKICFSDLAMSIEDVVTSAELEQAAGKIENDESGSSTVNVHVEVETARARLDELRVKLEEMGPVNMMALEELEESGKRFDFLTEQRRDILDSIKGTEEALTEIKKRSRERFRHAFAHINENFQKMFVELFGGGRGEMVLIDEDDVLESGIDLIAQPPGKRLQNVLLLSGGEKAMAAIALVLAIFKYRPSPFCLLDEVDAPLDEINVGRFADHVAEMSLETQFLVITHNKRTMESARALYGVTMEEPGVSKLVSVRFE